MIYRSYEMLTNGRISLINTKSEIKNLQLLAVMIQVKLGNHSIINFRIPKLIKYYLSNTNGEILKHLLQVNFPTTAAQQQDGRLLAGQIASSSKNRVGQIFFQPVQNTKAERNIHGHATKGRFVQMWVRDPIGIKST